MIDANTCVLIDDDEDDHDFFTAALKAQKKKITCIHYFRPDEALEELSQKDGVKPAYIFLDLNMPQLNGKECLRMIKQTPLLSDVQVIMYSTSSSINDINETRKIGATDYIIKPNNLNDLVMKLSDVFK